MLKPVHTPRDIATQEFGVVAFYNESSYAHKLVYVEKYPFMADIMKDHHLEMAKLRFNDSALKKFVDEYTKAKLDSLGGRIDSLKAQHAQKPVFQ